MCITGQPQAAVLGLGHPNWRCSVWSLMEQNTCNSGITVVSHLCLLPVSKGFLTNNSLVNGSLTTWSQFRVHFNSKHALASAPILLCFLFPLLTWHCSYGLGGGVNCVKRPYWRWQSHLIWTFKDKIHHSTIYFWQLHSYTVLSELSSSILGTLGTDIHVLSVHTTNPTISL